VAKPEYDLDLRNRRTSIDPTEASAGPGGRKDSGTKQSPGSGRRGTQCFCVSQRTSTTAEMVGPVRLLHSASPIPPHPAPLNPTTALMGIQQVPNPGLGQGFSARAIIQGQTCSCASLAAVFEGMLTRARYANHPSHRTFPGRNQYDELVGSASRDPTASC